MTPSAAEATAAARRIQAPDAGVDFALCPEHGLHGAREECFVCGGEVVKVPMVPLADARLLAAFVLAGQDTERPLADIRALRLGIVRDVWPAEDSEAGIGRRRALEVLDALLDELGVAVPPHTRDCYCDECEAYWARVPAAGQDTERLREALEAILDVPGNGTVLNAQTIAKAALSEETV